LADLDVADARFVDLRPEPVEHDRGDVDRHDATALWRDREGELPGSGADVDDDGAPVEAQAPQQRDLGRRVGVHLRVVPTGVGRVEVLAPGVRDLVQQPAGEPLAARHVAHDGSLADASIRSPQRERLIAERERACGVAFPASVVAWFALDGAERLFHDNSNEDRLLAREELGDPDETRHGSLQVAIDQFDEPLDEIGWLWERFRRR
jgi:hypothetical protein